MRNTDDPKVAAPMPEPLVGPQALSPADDLALHPGSDDEEESPPDPAPTPLAPATAGWQRQTRRTSGERRPLAIALLLSLLTHGLLLSLTFGGDKLGLPGLVAPWQDRRTDVPDLRVVIVPAHAGSAKAVPKPVAEPSQRPAMAHTAAARSAPTPPEPPALTPPASPLANAPAPTPTELLADAMQNAEPAAAVVEPPTPAKVPYRAAPVLIPEPAGVDVERADAPLPAVLAIPFSPSSVVAVTPSASSPQAVPSASRAPGDAAREAQKEQAARQEAARVEAVRLEAERQEAARQQAAQLEVQREAAARQAAARVEASRIETEREEAARQALARQEAQRQEAARREAARLEAERLDSERQEAARQTAARGEAQRQEIARQEAARVETARQEAARPAAAPQEPPRVDVEKEETARREAVRRAIGRQLDEEAAQREAASTAARLPNTLPYSLSTARRVRLWGRSDPNVELVQYAEAWARKIQFNTAVDTVRELAQRPHAPPLVTVAVRSDGSVESVTFVVTSGVAEVDETIRRIVENHKPYPVFPPALARQFDVIEIRRTWSFDSAIRLQ